MDQLTTPYGGSDVVEIRDRVRRVEIRLTNLVKAMGFAPTDAAVVTTKNLVAVTNDGALLASNAAVTLGELFSAAQKHRLTGDADVYVGNRYFGTMRTTRRG